MEDKDLFGIQHVNDTYILHFINVKLKKSDKIENSYSLFTNNKERIREFAEIILKVVK